MAKALLIECKKVIIVWDLYPAWREKGIKPCRHEDRHGIFQSLQAEHVDLDKVFLVCIQEELEAWLLADYRAVTAMLKPLKHPHPVGRISRFSKPDSIRNPKKKIDQNIYPGTWTGAPLCGLLARDYACQRNPKLQQYQTIGFI